MILWRKLAFIIVLNVLATAEVLIDNDGGYKNILVGITPEIPESSVESLLFQLEALFQSTSAALIIASKGNVFFKEIVFVIPKKYKELITRRTLSTGAKYFKRPDIFITENDIFINPYTVQNEGCGKPGLRIHIPRKFLEAPSSDNKAILLVREWSHYRYGVFGESGFANDEVYPACYTVAGSESTKVSDCTNDEPVYEFRRNKQYEYEQTQNDCSPVPARGKNDHIISSLMSNIEFPRMKHFCDNDTHPHDRNAPTKQNALCREQSSWEVISGHRDLKMKRKYSSNVKPTFKYILESNIDLLVAVDSSKEMDQNGRMELVRNAFAHFVFYNLPNNSTVGMMNMKDKDADPVVTSIQTQDDSERLINLFPEAYGPGDSCVQCTIQRVLEALKLKISNIIVITATDIDDTWTENIETMLKSRNVALQVIYFQQTLTEPAFLEGVAKRTGGTFHYIAEAFPSGASVSSLTLLYEAFRSIYESFSWMNTNHVLVDQKTFTDDCSPKCVLSFPSDRTLKSFQVLITGPYFGGGSPPVLKDTIQLDNGNQHFGSADRTFTYKTQIPAYMFTIEDPQPRLWNLTFERRSGNNKPIVIIVRATNDQYSDILQMRSWIAFDDGQNVDLSSRPPITIYSDIRKGNNPVIGAQVVAFIHQMSYNKQILLELKDTGDGDPDITRNDGIFSRYLTDVEDAGYHSITTVAERWSSQVLYRTENAKDKELSCCGSFIPLSLAYNSGPFKRITTHQSFFVKSQFANKNYPPRRVMDLRVENIEILKNNIKCYVLKWTAPGENADTGKAYSYDLRVFHSRDNALYDFNNSYALAIKMLNIQGPLLVPKEVGTIETAYVEVTNLTSGTYFIGMKTKSFSGKTSDVSNLVEIFYIDPSFTGSSGISFHTFPGDGTTETNFGNDTTVDTGSSVALAIGLSCGFLFLLFIIGIILLIFCVRNRKNKNTSKSNAGHSSKKTESNDALCNANGGGSISIISPVTSWGADSLISHYATLQKNKNVEMDNIMTAQQNKETDSVSFASSKYSYDNKIDQHSLYDPIYYNNVQSQDELNYPYNIPVHTPFSPIYTSSLRRYNNDEVLGIPDPSENVSFCNYNSNINNLSRLKTDV